MAFEAAHKQIAELSSEIQPKDLEVTEPIPSLAGYVDRLRAIGADMEGIMQMLGKIQSDLTTQMSELNAADTTKKLQDLKI